MAYVVMAYRSVLESAELSSHKKFELELWALLTDAPLVAWGDVVALGEQSRVCIRRVTAERVFFQYLGACRRRTPRTRCRSDGT